MAAEAETSGAAARAPGPAADAEAVQAIPCKRIVPHPLLPDARPDPEGLALLGRSIQRYGVICPVIVRAHGREYQLIAGRRRLAASRAIGAKTIPALVRDLSDDQVLEIALLENSHREDLSDLEEVEAFRKLTYEFPDATPAELASRFGLDLAKLRERMWLTELHPLVKEALYLEVLSREHAEALRGILDRARLLALVKRVYAENLSPEALRAAVRESAA